MQRIRTLFQKVERLQPGIYHYQAPPEDPRNYRLHLRVEPDGQGVLVVNASTILHLNQTAAEFAYHLVQDTPEEQAVQDVVQRYRVSRAQAQQDFQDFRERLEALIAMPDLDPVTFLDFERAAPYERPPSAPYRLDCALTYRLPPEANPEFTPTKRVERELTAQEWMAILDKAWQAGIPHVIFTGGEPTLREDLFELIQHAEQNGQVSGVISDGQRLLEAGYLAELLRTGLDHLMILLDARKETSWKALAEASSQDLFTSVHLTVDTPLAAQLPAVLGRLAQMKPNAVSLSAAGQAFQPDLERAAAIAANLGLELTWNLPVPYSQFNPISMEVAKEAVLSGAGRAWLYVEPDGDVLPAQGVNRVLGNLLRDPWQSIWERTRS